MQEERDKLKKKLLCKNKQALDDLGSSQPIQTVYSENSVKSMTGQQFPKEIRHVIYGSNQPSQKKPGIELWLSRKYLWKFLLSSGLNSCELHRKLTEVFENIKPTEPL